MAVTSPPFAIKCGGDVHDTPHLYYYHNDSDHLGASDFNIDPQHQWVVSNVGSFLPNSNTTDSTVSTNHNISKRTENQTLYQELYEKARISASSLRYYIVGLPDEDDYKVEIDFAEIVIEEKNSWRGLGRRYFNIFIQASVLASSYLQKKLRNCIKFSLILI